MLLGALLQFANVFLGQAVCFDGLLAVRGELGFPVALAGLLLGEGILLVLVVVFNICEGETEVENVSRRKCYRASLRRERGVTGCGGLLDVCRGKDSMCKMRSANVYIFLSEPASWI